MRIPAIIPFAALAVAALAACARGPIQWTDPVPAAADLAGATEIGFDASGRVVARARPPVTLPVFLAQCAATVRVSGDSVAGWSAAWWTVHPDSTAELSVSRSADGVTWAAPTRVDSADVNASGCNRVPPGIFVDGADIHVTYAMHASEGAGIFVVHSMDGGTTWHTPVAVAYGSAPGRAAVAARGDLVAVAYEDPNAAPARIVVSLSRTTGHLFEPGVVASPPTGPAYAPRVALGDGVIAVTWTADSASASGPRTLRTGTLR